MLYSLYFVLSLHTGDSDWNANEQTRNISIHIFVTTNVNLMNIPDNVTENKVD